MPPSHSIWQDAAGCRVSAAPCWPDAALANDAVCGQIKIGVIKGKLLSYCSKDLTPAGRWRRARSKSKKIWVTSPVLTSMHPQMHSIMPKFSVFREERKASSSYRKQSAPPVIRQRRCRFLSEFSISKERSVTAFVDGKHQRREGGTACYGLPGFFESARVIKFQRSPPAERPKERSCV